MDPLEQAAQIAAEVNLLYERIIQRGPTSAGAPPEMPEIERRLKEAEQILRKGIDEQVRKIQALSAEQQAVAERMKAEAEARMAAFTNPPPGPPPLRALEFGAKHAPPAAEVEPLLHSLMALPQEVLRSP